MDANFGAVSKEHDTHTQTHTTHTLTQTKLLRLPLCLGSDVTFL